LMTEWPDRSTAYDGRASPGLRTAMVSCAASLLDARMRHSVQVISRLTDALVALLRLLPCAGR